MGYGIGFVCKKCKNVKEILYGVGFFDSPFSYSENNFNKLIERGINDNLDNLGKLQNFIKLENVYLKDNYENYAYICKNCKIIDNKFRYMLVSNNKRFIPKYRCKYCNNYLKIKSLIN